MTGGQIVGKEVALFGKILVVIAVALSLLVGLTMGIYITKNKVEKSLAPTSQVQTNK